MNKKKLVVLLAIIIVVLLIIFFSIYYYKTIKNGNNIINKSEEEIIDYILNMKSYKAKLNVTIETNKNKTEYVIQQNVDGIVSKQEIIEPKNLEGLSTEYNGTNLKIMNNKLDLSTTFENYKYMVENRLWLNSFIEEYKNSNNKNKSVNEDDEIILEVKDENNKYNVYKKLYIDKKTCKPTKLIVQDINQKTLVYILYTEMEISK